jgi:hypothetical protein
MGGLPGAQRKPGGIDGIALNIGKLGNFDRAFARQPNLPLRAIPPLTALLAFERAASQLSFRRAARDLALSPSAISYQIRGLKAQFGVKLFVRGARSVRLTADGERYLAKVSTALAALQDAGREILRQRRDSGGELCISALPIFTSTVLIPALPDFKRRNPATTLRSKRPISTPTSTVHVSMSPSAMDASTRPA